MIPGLGRGMNPKKMRQMMNQLGISVEDVEDVEEVVIKSASRDFIFKSPSVTIMNAQGQKTFQIAGTPQVIEKEVAVTISPEDIKLVANQAHVGEDEAKEALEACNGNLADAIMQLMQKNHRV